MGTIFSKGVLKGTAVLILLLANIFFFQNCTQPFAVVENLDGQLSMNSTVLQAPKIGDYYVYGDMLVDAKELDAKNAELESKGELQGLSNRISGEEMWPGKVIPIRVANVNPEVFSENDLMNFRQAVFAACNVWAQEVDITCVQATGNEAYILQAYLTNEIEKFCGPGTGACATYPGLTQLRKFWAKHPSSDVSAVMLHEVGHNLGMMHEHQHDHVDQYYDYPAVSPDSDPFAYYFVLPLKYTNFRTRFVTSDYDPQSVMHYNSLSKYGIKPKPQYQYLEALTKSGAGTQLSNAVLTVKDILGAQKLYGKKTGSKPTCLHPATQKPYFFENSMQGFFSRKVAREPGESCTVENRICTNGQLSGSNTEETCKVICPTADGVELPLNEDRSVYIESKKGWDAKKVRCSAGGTVSVLNENNVVIKKVNSKAVYINAPEQKSDAVVHTWDVSGYGVCSAKPSYSYGAWSVCGSNSQQTRTATCVNKVGSMSRTVVCRNSTGQVVADSMCASLPKPETTKSCEVNCSGTPVTTQACTPPVTYSWEASAYGACSAKPSYSYGAWSACGANSQQTRTETCAGTSGTVNRTVVCRSSAGQVVADSMCASASKPATSTTCVANCSGTPLTMQSCIYSSIKKSCSQFCQEYAAKNGRTVKSQYLVSTSSYRCEFNTGTEVFFSVPSECTSVGSSIAGRACLSKPGKVSLEKHTGSSPNFSITNVLKVNDGQNVLHYTSNSSGVPDIVAVTKNGHYSLVGLKNINGKGATPSAVLFEGNVEDYVISRGNFDNQIEVRNKACGTVMLYYPIGGSGVMSLSFKNCSVNLAHSLTNYVEGTSWSFINGSKIPLNSTRAIDGCKSVDPSLHVKTFGW